MCRNLHHSDWLAKVNLDKTVNPRRYVPRGLAGRLYARLGERYPALALTLSFEALFLCFLVGIGVFTVYVEVTSAEFLRLALVALILHTAYTALFARYFAERTAPVRAWLEADRDPSGALGAWRAAAGLPFDFLAMLRRYGLGVLALAGYSAYAVWELDLPTLAFLVVFGASVVAQLYTSSLFFFVSERLMRPVLEDSALQLTEVPRLDAPNVPLRWRLLVTLPALNIATGVLVAGLSTTGHAKFSDLGVDVIVAVVVAFTASLGLSVLLSDSIVAPIRHLRAATDQIRGGDYSARVPVLATDEAGRLAESFNQMSVGLSERELLRDAFGAFVDHDLAERILREGTDLAGEEVEVSILFLDVRGFTTMSEQAEARAVVAKLNDLYEHVVPIVLRHGGHANKFIGDGMLAVFGAPIPHDDHADRAVAAAIDIALAVRERYRGELRVGLGVNSGPALVGTIGGGGRLDFTVIGDTVNTASRVESATRRTDDDLLISGATHLRLTRDFDGFVARPPMELKGKARPVAVYAARALDGDPADLAPAPEESSARTSPAARSAASSPPSM
jgi:class 3 adenylate cyclase